ncbi:hypothetical protein D7322_23730 [Sphingobacterium puteale]|uniref:CHAT domain-containing protein n=1 Tax=Sphingobacterium puteale TaxID=2420510 RepID=A0A420VS83_9SPHI|nr:hypothetical protein [Sphingobacterium puteale]RKO69243.1 hypothetical protein D7322_23730 [Sphingobacterium puteale]
MINLFLAFDEEDGSMGTFNQGCLEDFETYFHKDHPIKPSYIRSRTLNPVNIEINLDRLKTKSFIFSAYSHGLDDRLVIKDSPYIDDTNVNLFKNSLFYTVSCSSANILADRLIENGCHCYLGYKCLFNYWDGYREFSECANFGLFKIFDGVDSRGAFDRMLEKYNECIDRLVEENIDGFMQAALLRENRDGLVHKGNSISIKDFQYSED